MAKKPTLEEILTEIREATENWSSLHGQQQKWKDWSAKGAGATQAPEGYEKYSQPLKHIIRGGVAIIITDNPIYKAIPVRRGGAGDKQKKLQEQWAATSLAKASKQNSCDFAKELARTGLTFGIIIGAVRFDKTAWGERPSRKAKSGKAFDDAMDQYNARLESKWPYRFEAINPIWASPMANGTGMVIEYERMVSDLKEAFPEWTNPSNKSGNTFVKWQEWYDRGWKCLLADDEPILKGGGGDGIILCPRLPYAWRYTSFGENTRGATPSERCVGLLSGLDQVFIIQNNFLTAFFADVGNRIFHKFKQLMGSKGRPRVIWHTNKGPGSIVEVDNMKSLELLAESKTPPDFGVGLGLLDRTVQLATFSNELLGLGQAGTATEAGLHLAQARIPFKPFVMGVASVLEDLLEKAAYDFATNPDVPSMPVGGNDIIKQEDIIRPFKVEIDLQPVDPELNDRKQATGIQLWNKLSKATIIGDFFGKDPDIETRNQLKDRVLELEQTIIFVATKAMALAAARIDLNRAKELIRRAATGELPLPSEQALAQESLLTQGRQETFPGTNPDEFATDGRMGGRMQVSGDALGITAEQEFSGDIGEGGQP